MSDIWRLLDGSKTLGLGHCQPLLRDFAPVGLGGIDLPFLLAEEPAAIWPYLQLGWNLGGTQRKAANCACRGPSETAAPLSHPRLQRLPRFTARSADRLSLPGETGGSSVRSVSLHLSTCLMTTRACLPLVQTNQSEMGVVKQKLSPTMGEVAFASLSVLHV